MKRLSQISVVLHYWMDSGHFRTLQLYITSSQSQNSHMHHFYYLTFNRTTSVKVCVRGVWTLKHPALLCSRLTQLTLKDSPVVIFDECLSLSLSVFLMFVFVCRLGCVCSVTRLAAPHLAKTSGWERSHVTHITGVWPRLCDTSPSRTVTAPAVGRSGTWLSGERYEWGFYST